MQIKYGLVATLLALGCASASVEEPPAAEATEGAEPLPPAEPAPAASPAAEAAPAPAPAPAPEPPAAAAPPAPPPFAGVVIADVKDYDAWKTSFDGHVDARKQAGIVGEGVMRVVDNDKRVAVYVPASDAEKLKAFFADKTLKDRMKESGVKGKPTMYTFSDQGGKMAPPGKTGLFGAILECNVKDFAAFKTALEAQDAARTGAGIIGYGLGQGLEKQTTAYLYLQSEDKDKLKAYLDAKETKQAMKDAGVKGQPKVTVVQESSLTMYQ
jgi:hypothetical protein